MRHFRLQARFSGPLVSMLLTALAAVALVVGSVHVMAQTPDAKTGPTGNSAAAPAQSGANTESTNTAEHDEMNVYRHAPIVQSLARMLHLDVETTAHLFEVVNFVIIALAIGIPLLKLFPKVLHKRTQSLKHSLDSARKMTEEAHARMNAVEEKLAKLGDEIAQIRAQVEEEGKHDEARIKATIEEESSRIVAAAEQEIAAAAAHARRGLKNFAADLAIDQAARQLVLTAETDRALIGEFMKEAAKEGQN